MQMMTWKMDLVAVVAAACMQAQSLVYVCMQFVRTYVSYYVRTLVRSSVCQRLSRARQA
jgi:hypothetical protein